MSAISLKSITGITSITTPAGVDNQLTLHTNDTTQRVKVTQSGIEIVGVSTFQDIDVDGHTSLDNVNVSGTSTITGVLYPQNGIRVPDNIYSYFGTGNDLSIRHHASGGHHSYIFHHGAGVLKIGSDTQMILGETGPRNYIEMNPNSDVKLFFNNAEKLATSNTGVTVTGSITATGTIETTGSELKITGTEPRLTFTDTDNNPDFQIWANAQKFQIYDSTNSATRLLINSAGKVGINAASPVGNLQVMDTSSNIPLIRIETSDGGNKRLDLKVESSDGVISCEQSAQELHLRSTSNTTFSTGGSERLRITSGGKVCINNDTALSDLHVCTINSSEQDGTFRIGGSQASLGLVLDYDQYGNTVSRITANPTYTNGSALLKICVDGDANPDQLVLAGNGKIGVNIADNTTADLQVRTGTNGAGYFRLGGSNGNAIGMDITYTNSGATTTVFKQNYRSTHASALMEFDSGYFNFKTGTGGDSRLKISKNGQLLHGNSSEDQGWAIFWNAASGGADKGTAGQDGAGHQGVNIRSDMGPTHLDLDGTDNFTLKLINGAYSGSGIGDPNGTVAKILFNTNTYNGWNSYGAIALQSQGASAAKGQLVFMLNNGTNSMNEKLRIKSNEIDTANGEGINVYGENLNHTNDAVLFAHKTGNADWCIQASSIGNDYGMYARVGNSAAYGLAVYDSNNSTFRFRVGGNGAIYASNTTVQSISDQRLKENIVDANSQWDDIKALRFRNFNWKSDSGYADGKTYLGLIAQEVEPISPNLVEINAQTKEDIENEVTDPEYKNVKYSIVWMKAVKALQEAQARIEQLEAKVAALES